MTPQAQHKEIWLVYDGECPLCQSVAVALRIKEQYGFLNLLNAREEKEHRLIDEINSLGLDLDEGMVIYDGNDFFHGKEALRFMVRYGDNRGAFNLINKALYWSNTLAKVTYPWLRGIRNALLRLKKVGRIDNLVLKNDAIFKSIFGDSWNDLPPVMQKHYANHPYTNDVTQVEGSLDVMCKAPLTYLSLFMKLMGQIPIHNEKKSLLRSILKAMKIPGSFTYAEYFALRAKSPTRFIHVCCTLKITK